MHFAIVSYLFAPSKNIAGRRWTKFSRQLHNKGNQVTVITTENEANKEWYLKEFPGIEVCLQPKRNPIWVDGHTKNIIEKFKICVTSYIDFYLFYKFL